LIGNILTNIYIANNELLYFSIEDEEFLMNLHKYYNYFFPIKLYYKWLSYGNGKKIQLCIYN